MLAGDDELALIAIVEIGVNSEMKTWPRCW